MLKKQKICKGCQKEYTDPPKINIMGISKYCSLTCYRRHKSKNKPKTTKIGKKYKVSSVKQFKSKGTSVKAEPGTKLEKEVYDRDSKYLDHVRTYKCTVCNVKEGIHAHHSKTGGKGIKASDYTCIPLCVEHHTGGQYAIHKLGTAEFEKHFKVNIDEIINKLLIEYVRIIK